MFVSAYIFNTNFLSLDKYALLWYNIIRNHKGEFTWLNAYFAEGKPKKNTMTSLVARLAMNEKKKG